VSEGVKKGHNTLHKKKRNGTTKISEAGPVNGFKRRLNRRIIKKTKEEEGGRGEEGDVKKI